MKNLETTDQDINSLEQAARWVVKMNAGELSVPETDELHAWLGQSTDHEKLLLQASDVWDQSGSLDAELQSVKKESIVRTLGRTSLFSSGQRFAVATSLILAVSLVFIMPQYNEQISSDVVTINHATVIGEFKTFTLSDTSKITLNTNSEISVAFDETSKERGIILHKGEAYFDVATDALRPFIVMIGETRVRAVGTAFNIEKSSQGLEVIVTEGIVAVTDKDQTLTPQLTPGQIFISKGNKKQVDVIELTHIEKKLSWQDGRVVFEGERLEDVVAEISRYTTKKFIFSDDRASNASVGGSFRVGKVDEMLKTIEEGFDINVDTGIDGVVTLSSSL